MSVGSGESGESSSFGIEPVDPAVFEGMETEQRGGESRRQALTDDENRAWEEITDDYGCEFPDLDTIKQSNEDLLEMMKDMCVNPRDIHLRGALYSEFEELISINEQSFFDMMMSLQDALDIRDPDSIPLLAAFATKSIVGMTNKRDGKLAKALRHFSVEPLPRLGKKDVTKKVSKALGKAEDEEEIPERLARVYSKYLNDTEVYFQQVLREAYLAYDTESASKLLGKISLSLAEIVKYLRLSQAGDE